MHFKQLPQGLKAKMMVVRVGGGRGGREEKMVVVMATSQHLGSLFSRTVISNLPGAGFPHSTSNLNKAIAD